MTTNTDTTDQPPGPTLRGARLALLALSPASCGIGTTELVVMGLLSDVARDLAAERCRG